MKVTAKPGKAVSQTFRLDDLMQMAREEGRIVAEDAARRLGVTVQRVPLAGDLQIDLDAMAEAPGTDVRYWRC